MLRLYRTFRIVPSVTAVFHPLHRVAVVYRAPAEARWVRHGAFSCTVEWWDLFWTSRATNQLHLFHQAERQERNLNNVLGEGLRPRVRSATFLSEEFPILVKQSNIYRYVPSTWKDVRPSWRHKKRHATKQPLPRSVSKHRRFLLSRVFLGKLCFLQGRN